MPSPESSFLPGKYPDLPGSRPVERAVKKAVSEGKPGPQSREGRVEVYMDHLEDVISPKEGEKDPNRGLRILKKRILRTFTLPADPKNIDVSVTSLLFCAGLLNGSSYLVIL